MNNENEKDNKISLKDWLMVCGGFVLVFLCVIGATGQTFIGEFLTYIGAYLFGVFYPFVFAMFAILGIRMIYSKKGFPVKGKGLFWLGFALAFINLLAFGSYSFVLSDKTLSFTQLNSFYADRLIAFARYPFQIDNYQSLSSLGGGYLGTLLVTLFNPMWGYIGDGVLLSLGLLIGIFCMFFKPLKNAIIEAKREKAQKVGYFSPYQKKSKKHNSDEETPVPISRDPAFTKPFPTNWSSDYSISDKSKSPVTQGTITTRNEVEDVKPDPNQGGFTNTMTFTAVPEMRDQPLLPKDSSAPKITKSSPAPVIEEKPDIRPVEPIQEVRQENTASATTNTLSPVSSFLQEKSREGEPLDNEDERTASYRAKRFKENASSSDASTFEVEKPEPQAPIIQPSNINPLQEQAKEVNSSTYRETKAADFDVTGENQPAAEAPEPAETEEEKEARLEHEFFLQKQKAEQEELLKKAQEEDKKKASMMRFVSDKPKTYNYKLPSDALLSDIDDSDKLAVNSSAAQDKAKIINKVFDDFKIAAKAISFTIGASVTRFNIQTEPGVRSDKIASLVNELQRALQGDKSVRIETVVEGKDTSGIEIGNAVPMGVPFKESFRVIEENTTKNLLLPIGKEISGTTVTFPLDEMPHLLVAGTTGSGKSVLVNCMIMTLIMRNYPNQLKLMLIDPKQVEFAKYAMEPHLYCPVISDSDAAINGLKKLCEEMDRRYTVFKNWSCVKISEYRSKRINREDQMEELPDIVCVIDEFADLMQTSGDEVADYVQRLTQKARAAGIYLIIATQRPDKHVIPMVIKANIACRIGLSCSTYVDSRVILDENGAETLLGKGDLLFKCPGKKALIRAQSPFISNSDMEKVLTYLKQQAGAPSYNPAFLDLEVKKEDATVGDAKTSEDLYADVKEFVMKTGIVAKSKLMRNFALTYSKVDTFLVRMLQEGIIMQAQGGKYVVTKRMPMEENQ